MYLNNTVYDILKKVAQLVLPALATLYFSLSGVWNLPFTTEVIGTIVALEVFLGAIVSISDRQYTLSRALEGDVPVGPGSVERGTFEEEVDPNPWALSEQFYNLLKWVTLMFLPASGALYFTVATLWGLPNPAGILATVAAVTAFLGIALGVSTAQHNKNSEY